MAAKKGKQKGGKNRKKGRSTSSSINLKGQIQSWIKDRHPVVKFLLGFVGCMLIFYVFYYSSLYRDHIEIPLLNTQANISNALLNLFGYGTVVNETIISGGGFAVDIKSGCDGLEAMAILISGILIFPTSFKLKVPGLLWGLGLLAILNILRIAGLYISGRHFSAEVFDILHVQGGFIIFTTISVLIWFMWMNWCLKKIQETPSS